MSTIALRIRGLGDAAAGWLDRPLAPARCAIAWLLSATVFTLIVVAFHIQVYTDSVQSVFAAWALAHGDGTCAYAANVYQPTTAPLYILFSAAGVAIFRIGSSVPYPVLGPHCTDALRTVATWSQQTNALVPTVRIGLLAFPVLLCGVIAVLRTCGRGGTRWEGAVALGVAVLPPVAMCLCLYFHPEDLLALGLSLGALAAARRQRWLLAGLLVGLALESQQFALLVALPLLVLAPSRSRLRYLAGAVAASGAVLLPLVAVTSGRVLHSALVGTATTGSDATWLALTGLPGAPLHLVSRSLSIGTVLALALWCRGRFGKGALDPVPLVALIAACFDLRLLFDVAAYGYYLAAVAVTLTVLQAVERRVRAGYVVWLVLVVLAWRTGSLVSVPAPGVDPTTLRVSAWQLVLDLVALALPLRVLLAWSRTTGASARTLDASDAPVSTGLAATVGPMTPSAEAP